MCEYCEAGKGICTNNRRELGIELHSGSSKLVAYGLDEVKWDISVECKINYCPMCRKKVRRLRCGIYHFVVIKNVKIKNVKEIKIIITLC